MFKIICFSIEIMNWIALYFPRSLSSNQITDISPQVFEGLSTCSLLSELHVVMFATISGNKRCSARPYLQLFVLLTLFVFLCASWHPAHFVLCWFCVVVLFVFVFCTQILLSFRYSLTFIWGFFHWTDRIGIIWR